MSTEAFKRMMDDYDAARGPALDKLAHALGLPARTRDLLFMKETDVMYRARLARAIQGNMARRPGTVFIRNMVIRAERWSWQGRGWFPHKDLSQVKNSPPLSGGSRFGGGWNYALGVQISGSSKYGWTVLFNLVFGTVCISYRPRGDL